MAIIGIDVSKKKPDCLWLKGQRTGKVKSRVFTNNLAGYSALLDWAQKQTHEERERLHFIMEATGIYHEALATQMYQAEAKVSVVNPAQVCSYAKKLRQTNKNR